MRITPAQKRELADIRRLGHLHLPRDYRSTYFRRFVALVATLRRKKLIKVSLAPDGRYLYLITLTRLGVEALGET